MHQTEFQQKMLAKYGRTIVGMDATYKVCKWSFPFYLLMCGPSVSWSGSASDQDQVSQPAGRAAPG